MSPAFRCLKGATEQDRKEPRGERSDIMAKRGDQHGDNGSQIADA